MQRRFLVLFASAASSAQDGETSLPYSVLPLHCVPSRNMGFIVSGDKKVNGVNRSHGQIFIFIILTYLDTRIKYVVSGRI
jgi:hypothetical protein